MYAYKNVNVHLFSSLMTWGNKLSQSLLAQALRLQHLLPEGSSKNSLLFGLFGSLMILWAFRTHFLL